MTVRVWYKEYNVGSWVDWTDYVLDFGNLSKRVESDNAGEAGVIVYDNIELTFRYDGPVYTVFSADLTAKDKLMFKVDIIRDGDVAKTLFIGMTDLASLSFPYLRGETQSEYIKTVRFEIVDKLSAIALLQATPARVEKNLKARVATEAPLADILEYYPQADNITYYIRAFKSGAPGTAQPLVNPILFAGEILSVPVVSFSPAVANDFEYYDDYVVVDCIGNFDYGGTKVNKVTIAPIIFFTSEASGIYMNEISPRYYEKEIYSIDCNSVVGGVLQYIKGIILIEALVKQHWPDLVVTLSPLGLTYPLPNEYGVRFIDENPLSTTPLEALKNLANDLEAYIFFNKVDNLVIKQWTNLSLLPIDYTFTFKNFVSGDKKYVWDKIADAVEIYVRSHIPYKDEGAGITALYIDGAGTAYKFSGIEPRNKISKEVVVNNTSLSEVGIQYEWTIDIVNDTNAELETKLNDYADFRANSVLNFYGKRHWAFPISFLAEWSDFDWEVVDIFGIDGDKYFATAFDIDLKTFEFGITLVSVTGYNYDIATFNLGKLPEFLGGGSPASSGGISSTSIIGGGLLWGGTDEQLNVPLARTNLLIDLVENTKLSTWGGSLNIDTLGTITTGVWNGSVILGQYGGTGVANTGKTITLGGNLITSGAFALTLTLPATINATFPNEAGGVYTLIPNTRLINTSAPLTGGGDLSLDKTIALSIVANRPIYSNSGSLDIRFNATNLMLRLPSYEINTIQDIDFTATPQFEGEVLTNDLTFQDQSNYNIISVAGNIVITPTNGYLKLEATGTDPNVLLGNNWLKREGFVSQTTGWGISPIGEADFRYLYADEMHVKSFIADLEQALAGSQIITKSVAVVAINDFQVPTPLSSGQLIVDSFGGFDTAAVFQDSDWVRLRQFSRIAGSLTITDCWGTVVLDISYGSSGFDTALKTQAYTFTRSGTLPGSAVIGSYIKIGTLALDYGVSGNGFIESNAIDGLWGQNSPYTQIVTWASNPGNQTLHSRTGNLRGVTGIAGEYGIILGAGITSTDKYIRASNQTFQIHNISFDIYDGTNTVAEINTSGNMKLGTNITSATTTSFDFTASTGATRLGVLDNNKANLYFDGTALKMRVKTVDKIILDAISGDITVGDVGAGKSNVYLDSNSLQLRVNTTPTITLNSDGTAQIDNTLTLGSATTTGVLKSYGVTSILSNDSGFYLRDTNSGETRIGTADGTVLTKGFYWEGSNYLLKGGQSNQITSDVSTYWNYTYTQFVSAGILTEWTQTNGDFETDPIGTDNLTGWSEEWYLSYLDMHASNGIVGTPVHQGVQSYLMKVTKDTNSYPLIKPSTWWMNYTLGRLYKTLSVSSDGTSKTYFISIWVKYESHTNNWDIKTGITLNDGAGKFNVSIYEVPYSATPVWRELTTQITTNQSTITLEWFWTAHKAGESFPFLSNGDSAGIYVDDLIVYESSSFLELSNTGLYIFKSPHTYAKMGSTVFELKGLNLDADDVIVRGDLTVYGNTLIEGDISAIPPGYNNANWDAAYSWGDHSLAGYLTANQTITLSGDVTGSGVTSIATTIAASAIQASMLNNNVISGKTALTSGLVSTDELLVSDAGTVKRMDISVIETYMQNNLTFTSNENIDDRVAVLIQDGTGLTWTYDDAANTLTGNVSLTPFSTTNLSEGTNLYFTNERVDDRVAALLINTASITWAYNDTSNTLSGNVSAESIEDVVGAMVSGNTETLITVTYQDVDGTLDFVVDSNLANYDNSISKFFDIAGNGLTSSVSTVNVVGTSNRIIVNTNSIDIALTYIGQSSIVTVGILTNGSINWTGIITTTNIGTFGKVIIDNVEVDANSITTSIGNLNINSAGDIVFNPIGNDILPLNNYDLNIGSQTNKYLTLHAAELWVNTLVAEETITTTGGRLLITNSTELVVDIDNVVTTITVKHNNLKNLDIIYLEKMGQIEFIQVVSSYTANGNNWDYTVTRDLDGTGANNWLAGDAVVNLGQTGDGFMELYSHYSIKQNTLDSIYNYDDELNSYSTINYSDSSNWELFSEDTTPDVGDIIYFGKDRTFSTVMFYIGTAGIYDVVFAYEYWNGISWAVLTNIITPDFTNTGVAKWNFDVPVDWVKSTINLIDTYWVRIRIRSYTSWTTFPKQSFQPVYEGGQQVGPTIVGYERDSNTYNDFSPRWAIGNLNGVYGNGLDVYGVAFGKYVTTGNSAYIQVDSTNGLQINSIISGVSTAVFSVNMSGIANIGNWIVEEFVLRDINSWVVLKSGNDSGIVGVSGRILIDGYNDGLSYGMISVGTAITIVGDSTGLITVGDITIDGAANGIITLGTNGLFRSSTGGDRIEVIGNEILIYESANSTYAKITQTDFGLKIFQNYAQTYESYLKWSGSGLEAKKKQTSGRYRIARYGRLTDSGVGFMSLSYDDNSTWTNTKYFYSVDLNGKHLWYSGAGTAGTEDTNLYRAGVNLLKTDHSFEVALDLINKDIVYPKLTVAGNNTADTDITIKGTKIDDTDSTRNRQAVKWWISTTDFGKPLDLIPSQISISYSIGVGVNPETIDGLIMNIAITDSNETVKIRVYAPAGSGLAVFNYYLMAEIQGIVYSSGLVKCSYSNLS